VLRSLRLLRSTDPGDRARGIHVLSGVRDDPRVAQVFEHLYESDPDPGVREAAWRALNQSAPSIPSPVPAAPPGPVSPNPAPEAAVLPATAPFRLAPAEARASPPSADKRRPVRANETALFLLNPANAPVVAKEMKRMAKKRKGGRAAFGLAGFLLALAGILGGLALPDWYDWYRFHQDGVTVVGTLTGLEARGDRYYALYTFEIAPGGTPTAFDAEQRITEFEYEQLDLDTPVDVTYLPDAPDTSRIDAESPIDVRRNYLGLAALGVLAAAALFVALGLARRAGLRGRHLLRGQVVECVGRLDDDGDFKIRLRYRFRTPSGRVLTGQIRQIRNDLKRAPLPAPGAPVAVYYRNERSYKLL
jgi:hypothetical protein